jgi:hypothetical protein
MNLTLPGTLIALGLAVSISFNEALLELEEKQQGLEILS